MSGDSSSNLMKYVFCIWIIVRCFDRMIWCVVTIMYDNSIISLDVIVTFLNHNTKMACAEDIDKECFKSCLIFFTNVDID